MGISIQSLNTGPIVQWNMNNQKAPQQKSQCSKETMQSSGRSLDSRPGVLVLHLPHRVEKGTHGICTAIGIVFEEAAKQRKTVL